MKNLEKIFFEKGNRDVPFCLKEMNSSRIFARVALLEENRPQVWSLFESLQAGNGEAWIEDLPLIPGIEESLLSQFSKVSCLVVARTNSKKNHNGPVIFFRAEDIFTRIRQRDSRKIIFREFHLLNGMEPRCRFTSASDLPDWAKKIMRWHDDDVIVICEGGYHD
jgi:hypothetical protein